MEVKILGKNEAGIKVNNIELNDIIEALNLSVHNADALINMDDAELQTNILLSGSDKKAVPTRKELIQFKHRQHSYLLLLNSLYKDENQKEQPKAD
ncbi:hypothetical protein ACFS6H_16460 [Terrimonas rubra]|uniref:Uncharacterized protein n=1 Tax=Terrimonas rubra TaxID=1035890 RepID=A0ABW6AAH9_9BACT